MEKIPPQRDQFIGTPAKKSKRQLDIENALSDAIGVLEDIRALVHAVESELEEIQNWTKAKGCGPDDVVHDRANLAYRLALMATVECRNARDTYEALFD